MFVDLDDFKEVNDRLGHAAGDQLLTGVAARLRGVLRDSDVLARQGGDEFLVLLTDLSETPAPRGRDGRGQAAAARCASRSWSATAEVRTGASIGISLFPADAADTEALLRHADAAMYRAKADRGWPAGLPPACRGHRRPAHQRLGPAAPRDDRLRARAALPADLAPGGAERGVDGVEALLRWRHPDRGLLRPAVVHETSPTRAPSPMT